MTVRVLTLNTFLLDVNLRSRQTSIQRLPLIAPEVCRLEPDIVVLQEVWGGDYRRYLEDAFAQRGWPFSTHACPIPMACASTRWATGLAAIGGVSALQVPRTSRWSRRMFLGAAAGSMFLAGTAAFAAHTLRDFGNGLLIISRWPIVETTAMSFRTHSRLDEALVYKGAIRARIRVPGVGDLDVVNTHLGARTFEISKGAYSPATVRANDQQVDELVAWLRSGAGSVRDPAAAKVVAGDFNFNPWVVSKGKITGQRSPSYGKLVDAEPRGLGLTDSFVAANAMNADGFTGGTATAYGAAPAGETRPKPPERIDYIFACQNIGVQSSEVVLNDVIRDRPDGPRL